MQVANSNTSSKSSVILQTINKRGFVSNENDASKLLSLENATTNRVASSHGGSSLGGEVVKFDSRHSLVHTGDDSLGDLQGAGARGGRVEG